MRFYAPHTQPRLGPRRLQEGSADYSDGEGFAWATATNDLPLYDVDENGVITCVDENGVGTGADCEELWEQYQYEDWMEKTWRRGSCIA